jgi:hypothetical protein
VVRSDNAAIRLIVELVELGFFIAASTSAVNRWLRSR